MKELKCFAMVTSPNQNGVVVIGGEYKKMCKDSNFFGFYVGWDVSSRAIFELDGKIMKWIRLDQNLKFGRKEHSVVQIPSNLTIELDKTVNDDEEKSFEEIVKNVKDLADDYYLEIDEDQSEEESEEDESDCEDKSGSEDDSFPQKRAIPHSKDCATFIRYV